MIKTSGKRQKKNNTQPDKGVETNATVKTTSKTGSFDCSKKLFRVFEGQSPRNLTGIGRFLVSLSSFCPATGRHARSFC
jgi:hypothetical protein